ncbi:MAG TPA: winged helix-turn-helix domain-containing protein [Steroidobacteraceae bacterium]|nr:winged helix-turn-helix domain-containing protein [Steroidobacteraceae bacterium]
MYCFGHCELDPRERRLRVHGQALTLSPKVFDTLVLLVERAGHVVSKEELMKALWPRGFVHESNLTKHIWLIRRALGDGEGESRFIETVPKLGYRFVAPVRRGSEEVAAATPISSPPEAAATRDRWKVLLIPSAGAALLALVALAWWRADSGSHGPGRTATALDSNAVAIVDFNNLSGNAKDAWLGPALKQMLATEVAASGRLHAIPDELARPASVGLPLPGAGGYAPASLTALRQRLGSHFVLSGGYVVSGSAESPTLRVDITAQDAEEGRAIASFTRQAAVSDLPNLLARLGDDLRRGFGEPVDPATMKQVANVQPASAEIARHLGFALQALGEYDAARARDELLQTIAQSPGYAPAYLYLSRAWSMLGYTEKALAAANQAAQYSEGLPREQQLQIRAQRASLAGNVDEAVIARGELADLRHHNPDFRLQWIAALASAARYEQARSALIEARRLPELRGDPRLEITAANVEFARDSHAAALPHARLAWEQARARGALALAAEAELLTGIALDQSTEAEPTLRRAAADFHALGNPHGEANAWQNLGNLQSNRNQISAARESYQRAMMIYQGIGDLGGEAAIYNNVSDLLWNAGDRDGTEAALRQALAIARQTSNDVRTAWTLTGLATVLADDSASDEAATMYREAIALDQKSGARAHLAFALSDYADLLRMGGQLTAAREACARARAAEQVLDASARTLAADFECAQVDLDRGDVDGAAQSLGAIEKKAVAAQDTFYAANAQLLLGQIAIGREKWSAGRAALQESLAGWSAAKESAGEATASALLAVCADGLKDPNARDQEAARARELRGGITQRAEVFQLDVTLAELRGISGQRQQAHDELRALTLEAIRRRWPGLALEARLAELHMLALDGDSARIDSSRKSLDAEARRAGYGWVRERLRSPSSI